MAFISYTACTRLISAKTQLHRRHSPRGLNTKPVIIKRDRCKIKANRVQLRDRFIRPCVHIHRFAFHSAIYVWLWPRVFVCARSRVIQRVSLFALDQILSFELNTPRGARHAGCLPVEIVGQSLQRLANKTEKGLLTSISRRRPLS